MTWLGLVGLLLDASATGTFARDLPYGWLEQNRLQTRSPSSLPWQWQGGENGKVGIATLPAKSHVSDESNHRNGEACWSRPRVNVKLSHASATLPTYTTRGEPTPPSPSSPVLPSGTLVVPCAPCTLLSSHLDTLRRAAIQMAV